MLFDVCRVAAYSAHGIAVVAVVAQDGGVSVEARELFVCTRGLAVVIYAAAYGEVLVTRTDYRAKGGCCDDCA